MMFCFKIWFTFVCAFSYVKGTPFSSRIINGTVSEESHPWVARIVVKDENTPKGRAISTDCGGSLIDPKWVITAKHCLLDNNTKEYSDKYEVSVGNNDWTRGQFITVLEHFLYSKENHIDDDIALLLLEKEPTNVEPIPMLLDDDINYGGKYATLYGWGRTDPKLKDKDECPKDVLCFDPTETSTNSCVGDSGGPMTMDIKGNETLCGMAHVGEEVNGVGCSGTYSSYTKSFYKPYAEWIKKTMSENKGR
ncbi:vitamin K-dependent protein C-like isoform X4 [Chrysoperla carnea]|uniref:vitamin K-dependent protein C-like isoform X4 n=1 Tax=Chrysoperla carnea TaxID=189513 RepID=UPI001D07F729|nr:vitamin K-dependent protein C-like isoform X4 [Chrysoperla carnea]